MITTTDVLSIRLPQAFFYAAEFMKLYASDSVNRILHSLIMKQNIPGARQVC